MKKLLLLLFVLAPYAHATVEVAITVDDLPVHGKLPDGMTRSDVTKQMLATLDKHNLKNTYGFINADEIKNIPDRENALKLWVNDGQLLGNHTFNHINLETSNVDQYIQEIKANDTYLIKLMGNKDYHYFRYPYLYEGETEQKRNAIRNYLASQNYKIAEVTIDFGDYLWNNPYARCRDKGDTQSIEWLKQTYLKSALNALKIAHELSMLDFNRDIKNILLLHIGAFDALMLDDVINAYQKQDAHFISLQQAMQDSVYKTNPNVAKKNPYTFLAQIRSSKNISQPEDIKLMQADIPIKQLKNICR